MSKKDFTGGLSSLLGDQPDKPKLGRPITNNRVITKSSQEGIKENETRATFIINENLLEKIKAIAYWKRTKIKDIVNKALLKAVQEHEDKNGEIEPIPAPEN